MLQKIFYLSDLLLQYSLENEALMLRAQGCEFISPEQLLEHLSTQNSILFYFAKNMFLNKPD